MRQGFVKILVVIFLLAAAVFVSFGSPVQAMGGVEQQATQAIATVTGTPSGPMAVVVPGTETQINLRSGPNTIYDIVGVLLVGQQVPAKGRSPGGTWVEVEYPGVPGGVAWIFSTYIKIVPPMELPIVEIPPTPTPQVTVTVDPTLAARFIITAAPTRLATFTAPPPLSIPTYQAETTGSVGPVPMGFVILGLAVVGILFGLISLAQGR